MRDKVSSPRVSPLAGLEPAEVILARTAAFRQGNFGWIYESFHSESHFRRQFCHRTAYVQFAADQLQRDFEITDCQILKQDQCGDEARVIFLMQIVMQGQARSYAELAWLRRERGGWHYHRGQKWDDPGPEDLRDLDFSAFDRLEPRIIV